MYEEELWPGGRRQQCRYTHCCTTKVSSDQRSMGKYEAKARRGESVCICCPTSGRPGFDCHRRGNGGDVCVVNYCPVGGGAAMSGLLTW